MDYALRGSDVRMSISDRCQGYGMRAARLARWERPGRRRQIELIPLHARDLFAPLPENERQLKERAERIAERIGRSPNSEQSHRRPEPAHALSPRRAPLPTRPVSRRSCRGAAPIEQRPDTRQRAVGDDRSTGQLSALFYNHHLIKQIDDVAPCDRLDVALCPSREHVVS